MEKFDYTDIAATHKIIKRDARIAYTAMRKIHYNVMQLRDILTVDEAEVLVRRFISVRGRHYVLRVSYNSLIHIYKPTSTLKVSLENRLKREGYVERVMMNFI